MFYIFVFELINFKNQKFMNKRSFIFTASIALFFSHVYAQESKTDSLKIKNQHITTNSQTLQTADLNRNVAFTPIQLLAGKVPGLTIQCSNTNDPNPTLEFQLRGASTMVLSTELLYVVDGIQLNNIDFLIPENIASIRVLKNISETSQYGMKGCNGVVIITTKQASKKAFNINFSSFAYIENFSQKSDYTSAAEWRKLKNDWKNSTNKSEADLSIDMIDYNASTDWRKEISQQKISQSKTLQVSGTINKTSYSASGLVDDFNGMLQKTNSKKYKGQFNITQKALNDKLSLSVGYSASSKKYSNINNNQYTNKFDIDQGGNKRNMIYSSLLSTAETFNPTIPIYFNNGNYGRDTLYYDNYQNPVEILNNTNDNRKLTFTNYSIEGNYEIIKGLSVSAAYNEQSIKNDDLATYKWNEKNKKTTDTTLSHYSSTISTLTSKLNYSLSADKHNVDIELVFNQFNEKYNGNYLERNYVAKYGSNYYGETERKQYLATLNYNYNSVYYLSTNLLKDESDLYNYDNCYYPSVNVAWEIANEENLRNLLWLNKLTLRGGYGETKRILSVNPSIFNSGALYAPELKNEKLIETNIGTNVNVLDNRIQLAVDYYERKTKDGLVSFNLASGTTFYNKFISNKLEIKNRGFEINLTAIPLLNPVKWSISGNISFNKNTVKHKNSDEIIINKSIGDFNGYRFAGLDDKKRILYHNPKYSEPTTSIPQESEVLGNGIPKSYFGLSNTFNYKHFELNISLRGASDFDIRNYTKTIIYYDNIRKKNIQFISKIYGNYNTWYLRETDFVVEKGDYVKIDNISLGYTFNLEKQHIEALNIYVACNNVATFTKFSGGDPEAVNLNNDQGMYNCNTYPQTRLFVVGLKLAL